MRPTLLLALLAAGCRTAPDASRVGDLEIRGAYAFETVLGDVASAYLSIRNTGTKPDRLRGAESDAAGRVMMHGQVDTAGQTVMRHLETVELPPGATVVFAPGGLHFMLDRLAKSSVAGDTLNLILHFDRAGDVRVRAPVRRYGEHE